MPDKPTYEALEKRVHDLEQAATDREKTVEALKSIESELKRTKDAFRQSEETARALLDASTESAFLIELDGTFVDMNEVTAARLGKSVEALIGKNVFDFLPPKVAKERKKLLDNIIRKKEPIRAEDARSGFIFDSHILPVLDSKGNVYRLAVFSRDITKQKLVEKSLRESEYKYRSLFHHLSDAVFIHDLDGNIIDVNQNVEVLFGYSKTEILSFNISMLHPAGALEASKQAFETILQDGSIDFEIEFKKKDGAIFLAEVSSSLLELGGKRVVQGIARDITERRRVENELERMAREWQNTFDTASDAIWLLDKDMRIQRANKASYQLFKDPGRDLIGKHCWEIVHGTEDPIPDCPTMMAAQSLCRETLELQMGRNWFQVTVDPLLNSSGEYDGAIHFLTDITERKEAEEALRESELKYHDLYHNAPDMYVSVDAKTGNVLQCNNTLAEALGYKNEEIIGRPVFDLYAPSSVERAETEVFPEFIKTGEIKGEELQLQKKDGSVIDVSLSVSATRDDKGNILHSRSAWRDITKQKQAEKEKEKLINELQEALKEIKTLRGILPLCSFCKKVRDDKGYWEQVDVYIHKHSLADISHSVCPDCLKKHYSDLVTSKE